MTKQASNKPWEAAKREGGSGDDPLAAQFVQSLSFDRRLYKHDIAGSIAHARMLADVGLINKGELRQIERGLGRIEKQIDKAGDDWPGWRIELEDVHMCIEAALIDMIGDAGRKLHTGRSRNDQVALDLKLWMAEAAGELDELFHGLFKAFIELAERDGQIVMPSYTHLQRAQPIVVGGELMAWLAAFDRCRDRLAALAKVNRGNPLGAGAIAGSALPIDRAHAAGALGVGRATENSIDTTATRDAAVDFVYGLAMTAMTLSRWAEQWIMYATTEFSFIELDERYTTGSSMMPQKRNPDMLELIRGRCGDAYGRLTALLTICKGLPIGYSRDLQEDKRHVFAAYDSVSQSVAMAAAMVGTTRFDEAAIAAGLDRGFADATSLAEYLVTRGVPFRTAHQMVGRLVRHCIDSKIERLDELSVATMNQVCSEADAKAAVCDDDVYQWLGAANVVKRYRTAGNAGRSGFARQLRGWKKRVGVKG